VLIGYLRLQGWRFWLLLAVTGLSLTVQAWSAPVRRSGPVHTNPLNNDPLVHEAYQHYYVLDYAGAVDRFERFHQQHAGDPQATALLLNAVVFRELFEKDLLDTTFYSNDGFLTGRHATDEDVRVRDRVFALSDEAVHEADWRISQNPSDADAYFARAWTRALRCTYVAMIERSFGTGFKLALKARDDAQRALQIEPNYADAELITGVYQYVVGSLPIPFKILIGFVGMTGSKANGLAMLRDTGERSSIVSFDARTAIALFLRREARYNDAIAIIRGMKHEYPRNFLFWLEEANLRKDAGEGMEAVEAYREILNANGRAGFFGETHMQLAEFGLGEALRGQRHYREAAEAYERAAWTPGVGSELKIRSLLAGGECRDANSERAVAVHDYQESIAAGPNTSRADAARKRLRTPFKGN
jgi:tetratricopeptide (TPR) repeat protein